MKDTTDTVCQRNSSEAAQQNFLKLCSYEGLNAQLCISTGNSDSIFISGSKAPFELINFTKIKITILKTVRQCNSPETAQQNFMKLCSYEGHNMQICIFTGNADLIFFRSNLYPFLTLAKIILCNSDETGFLSDCLSLKLGIAIRCIQHSQAMLERDLCKPAHSFFHFYKFDLENSPFFSKISRGGPPAPPPPPLPREGVTPSRNYPHSALWGFI